MAKKQAATFTGIELGTGAIKVAIGEMTADDILILRGMAEEKLPHHKIIKGEVVDADPVIEHLAQACSIAESMAGANIDHLLMAVTGGHISCLNNLGRSRVNRQDRRITDDDVVAAHDNAKNYSLPIGKQLINNWDRRYIVDSTRETLNPSGLIGDMVEAEIHVIYGQLNNIMTGGQLVADLMDQQHAGFFFSPVASGYAVCTPDEMRRGRLVIDIGEGVTEYCVFQGPGIFHSGQITVGCQHIVNDLALGLNLPYAKCETVLNQLGGYGSAIMRQDNDRFLEIASPGRVSRRIPFSSIETVIEVRLRELFEVILEDLRSQDALSRLGMGAVLTGGGSLIPEIDRLAQQTLSMPTAIGWPRQINHDHRQPPCPRWATPLGLIRLGAFAQDIEYSKPSVWDTFRTDVGKFTSLLGKAFRW